MTLDATWRTSSRSTKDGECVEVAVLPTGLWAVRDSKNPTGPALRFTTATWSAFTTGIRAGEFD
jgi:hypothetical protein